MSPTEEEPEDPLASGYALPILDAGETPLDADLRRRLAPFQKTLDHVKARILGWGLPIELTRPTTPFPAADLPKDMSADALVQAYDTHLGWQNYLSTICADADNQVLAAKNVLAHIEAELRRTLKANNRRLASKHGPGYLSEQDIGDAIEVNPVYTEAKVALQTYKQLLETSQALLSVVTRNMQALSRLITIRGQEIQRLLFGGGGSALPGGKSLRGSGIAPEESLND